MLTWSWTAQACIQLKGYLQEISPLHLLNQTESMCLALLQHFAGKQLSVKLSVERERRSEGKRGCGCERASSPAQDWIPPSPYLITGLARNTMEIFLVRNFWYT